MSGTETPTPETAPEAQPIAAATPTRRGFHVLAAAWVAFSAGVLGGTIAIVRFLFPNVLFEKPTRFKIGRPEDFTVGEVDERYKDRFGIWVVRESGGIYVLTTICTHLGCTPNWLPAQNKFKCPCHGSGYYKSGINFEGPTPRPLERAAVSLSPDDGQVIVDKSRTFLYEAGGWDDPASFLRL